MLAEINEKIRSDEKKAFSSIDMQIAKEKVATAIKDISKNKSVPAKKVFDKYLNEV